MQLQLQTFTSLVQNMAAAVQSAATQLLDLTVGSTLRAVLEANASIALWMQWLILQVMQVTRAATSIGSDLDSWMADFSLTRLPAVPATGYVTLSRFTPTSAAFIPVGTLIRTADGTQTFSVTASNSDTNFSLAQSGYMLSAGIASIDVPVQATLPGSSGNVLAGAISLLATALSGIDTVNNGHALQNGLDSETDAAFRTRFASFIDSRSRATLLAIGYEISKIQQGLQYTIQENIDASGYPRVGSFIVTVDDGSGSPSPALLAAANSAVNAVRPIGSIFTILPPNVAIANITLTVITVPESSHSVAVTRVSDAISSFINQLPIGGALPLTRLAQLAYTADGSITNVSQLEINATAADMYPSVSGVIKAGTVAVN
jgi:uncharacterized phage protein gp47/JayE